MCWRKDAAPDEITDKTNKEFGQEDAGALKKQEGEPGRSKKKK